MQKKPSKPKNDFFNKENNQPFSSEQQCNSDVGRKGDHRNRKDDWILENILRSIERSKEKNCSTKYQSSALMVHFWLPVLLATADITRSGTSIAKSTTS